MSIPVLLKRVLPLVVATAVLVYLVGFQLDHEKLLASLGSIPWWSVLLALLLTFSAFVLQALRMHMLFGLQGYRLGFFSCLRATLIGLLYGNVIPLGQVGGDPIKAFYLTRWSGCRISQAMAATIIDRLVGILVLAALAVVGILSVTVGEAKHDDVLGWVRLALVVFLALACLGFGVLVSKRTRRYLGISAILHALPGMQRFEPLRDAFRVYRRAFASLFLAGLCSLAGHLCLIGAVYAVGSGLEVASVTPLTCLAAAPIASIVAIIPGLPGGWGIGDVAFVKAFGLFAVGAEVAMSMSIACRLAVVLLSLLGWPALLREPEMVKPASITQK